jgi:hypothetical protein
LVVGFRAGLHVFDGDFYNEFSATDILFKPGYFCSHVILVERHHFDVHAFCHKSLSSYVRSYIRFEGESGRIMDELALAGGR